MLVEAELYADRKYGSNLFALRASALHLKQKKKLYKKGQKPKLRAVYEIDGYDFDGTDPFNYIVGWAYS